MSPIAVFHGHDTKVELPQVIQANRRLDFVVSNRSNKTTDETSPAYDLVFGPVANDDVYRTVELYEDGDLTKAETIARLKVKELYNQIVFRTQRALNLLEYLGADEVIS